MKYEEALNEYIEKLSVAINPFSKQTYEVSKKYKGTPVTNFLDAIFNVKPTVKTKPPKGITGAGKSLGSWAGQHKMGLGIAGVGGLLAYNALKNKPNENRGY
jgi:hypothetical protein